MEPARGVAKQMHVSRWVDVYHILWEWGLTNLHFIRKGRKRRKRKENGEDGVKMS